VTHRYRRPGLLFGRVASFASIAAVAGLVASLAAPGPALAAVSPETTLTVQYVDSGTLLPVGHAAIQVTARQDGAVIAEFSGETDAAGTAVLADLPRETGEGGVVTLDVVAHKATSFTDEETGCVLDDTWDASRLGVAVDGTAVAVAFTADEQLAVSSIDCPPGQAAPTGEVGGAQGTPGRTLPPTDLEGAGAASSSAGAAAVIAGLLGVSAGALVLVPRRRRADVRVKRPVRR
jgi:hypothetical protein